MGYHPRIETPDYTDFITSRTRNSELWFINNKPLEEAILGYVAKYQTTYKVTLYALAIEGNHMHITAHFENQRRKDFMRDLKSRVARSLPYFAENHEGGTVWERRYSNEFLPDKDDVENWFFYTVLQPVNDGLVEKLEDYPGYNSFHDAIWGIKRKCYVLDRTAYSEAKRWNKNVNINDYIKEYTLEFTRLPGYEELSQEEYAKLMTEKLEIRRLEIVKNRLADGRGFLGKERLKKIRPGSKPQQTKTSTRDSHRPRILCVCPVRRAKAKEWYFSCYFGYKEASSLYRAGAVDTVFPNGMYRPYFHPLIV